MPPRKPVTDSLFPEEFDGYLKPEIKKPPEWWTSEVLPGNGVPEFEVHTEHAFGVIDRIMEAYREKEFPYNLDRTRLPQDERHMPPSLPRGGKEHAMFFFNACYVMRGGIKSNDAIRRMSLLYENRPELFDADYARTLTVDDIKRALKDHGIGMQEAVSRQWIENSKRLMNDCEGDPRALFVGVSQEGDPYQACLDRVMSDKNSGYVGFKKKMTSMLVYYLMEGKMIEHFPFPLPVDMHVMRVSVANQMMTFPDAPHGTNLFHDEVTDALRELYYEYLEARQEDPIELSNAVWMLSESICGKTPGNVTDEPDGRKHRQGRGTFLVPKPINPDDIQQRRDYANSCAKCPVNDTCEYNIPGKHYYVGGALIIRGKRVVFKEIPVREKLPSLTDSEPQAHTED